MAIGVSSYAYRWAVRSARLDHRALLHWAHEAAIGDPRVGVCLDSLNSITKLVGVAEAIDTLAPLAVSVHTKDAVITRHGTGFHIAGCPLGEGLVGLPHTPYSRSRDARRMK